jgi:excinuclease ABC subunit C
MEDASELLDFENAAKIRDRIAAINKTIERQHVVSSKMEDMDAVGIAQAEETSRVVVLLIRKGAVLGSRNFVLKNDGWSGPDVLEAFLKQYYHREAEAFIPKQILVSERIPEARPIEEWLSDRANRRVSITNPQRGEKLRFIRMAVDNAQSLVESARGPEGSELTDAVQAGLHLKRSPRYIEGFDISDIQGRMAVGSVVSFVDGLPNRGGYRNYRIKTVDGADDYGMMSELVSRRIEKGSLPDLFLVDGGKGHLSAVKKVLDRHDTGENIELASIAKPDHKAGERHEKVYVPGRKNPVRFDPGHPALHLLMRIRDEAHRRAISHHRKLRKKKATESVLDNIRGVGKKRKGLLLKYFNDIEEISKAEVETIAGIPGIGRSVAEGIVSYFKARRPGAQKKIIIN